MSPRSDLHAPVAAAMVAASLLLTAPASADPTPDASQRADKLANDAAKAVAKGDLDRGRTLLLESLALKPSFDTMGNLGAIELAQKRYRECAEHLSASLRNYPPTGSERSKKTTASKLAECRKHVGALQLTVVPNEAEVTVDGAAAGRTPLADPLFLEPGKRVIEIKREAFEVARHEVTAVAGREAALSVTLAPRSGAAPMPTPSPVASTTSPPASSDAGSATATVPPNAPDAKTGRAPMWPVIAGSVGTVALLGAGVGLYLASTSTESDGDAARAGLAASGKTCPTDCAELIDTYDSASAQRNAATGMFVGAGVTAAGTLAYFLLANPTAARGDTAWIPLLAPDRIGLVVRSSF